MDRPGDHLLSASPVAARRLNDQVPRAIVIRFIFLSIGCGLAASVLLASPGRADDPRDYFIQKVCVDAQGHVLPADPYHPPPGSHLRNLLPGEKFPYYKHDQAGPLHPDGVQRHDSYPVLDKEGREFFLNPFYFGENVPGNGYDLYAIRSGWASAPSTFDGGGFSTTFFGEDGGQAVPYNGWIFFPESFVTGGYVPGRASKPITGRDWEQNGEPWPGQPSPSFLLRHASEDAWRLVPSCEFGGIGGAETKSLDAIQVVHGYVSKSEPGHDLNLTRGHLEIYYFTKLYGATRWEVWRPLAQLGGDYNHPSEVRTKALAVARESGRPILAAGERYVQPSDLPPTPDNRLIVVNFKGRDGDDRLYVVTAMRDWSAVKILSSPELPPPCPIPQQNLLANFHFDHGSLAPWHATGISWKLAQSHTVLDRRFSQTGAKAGVRYLELQSDRPGSGDLYQDIPVADLHNGWCSLCVKLRTVSAPGAMRVLLQQVDQHGAVISTDVDFKQTIQPANRIYSYAGPDDPDAHASVVLSSTLMAKGAPLIVQPGAVSIRCVLQPQTNGAFDILEANVSLTAHEVREAK